MSALRLQALNHSLYLSSRDIGIQLYPGRPNVQLVAETQSVGHYLGDRTRIGTYDTEAEVDRDLCKYSFEEVFEEFDLASNCRVTHLPAKFTFASRLLPFATAPLPPSMAEPSCNDETSEDCSTSYSDFCDDDTIRGATTPGPDATQNHGPRYSSPPPSTNTSYSLPSQVLGKRKEPDGAEGSVAGPSALYSYKKGLLSDSIETDSILGSSDAATLDSHHSDETLFASQSSDDTPTPHIIVGSVNIGPRRDH